MVNTFKLIQNVCIEHFKRILLNKNFNTKFSLISFHFFSSGGRVAGTIFGILFFASIIGIVIYCCCRKRPRSKGEVLMLGTHTSKGKTTLYSFFKPCHAEYISGNINIFAFSLIPRHLDNAGCWNFFMLGIPAYLLYGIFILKWFPAGSMVFEEIQNYLQNISRPVQKGMSYIDG